MANPKFDLMKAYEASNGVIIDSTRPWSVGYKTAAEAHEFARLKCDYWGSSLVYLGAEQLNNLFYPGFNVWD